MDVLKDEFRALKAADQQLQREIILMNYQFFSHANDSQLKRKLVDNVNCGQSGIKREALVENAENGFDKIDCLGYTVGGDQQERWFILMKDPLGFEIGGKARSIEALISPVSSLEQGGGSSASA